RLHLQAQEEAAGGHRGPALHRDRVGPRLRLARPQRRARGGLSGPQAAASLVLIRVARGSLRRLPFLLAGDCSLRRAPGRGALVATALSEGPPMSRNVTSPVAGQLLSRLVQA